MKNINEIIRDTIRDFLNEHGSFLDLNKNNITKVIQTLRNTYSCGIEKINGGECDDFAVTVMEKFFSPDTVQSLFNREMNGVRLVTNYDVDDTLEDHVWILFDGLHYDAEAPDGVENYRDLPIFKRQLNKTNQLKETYSSDREEIVEFLNSLPDEIQLYRGLIVPKEKNTINKKNLGVHWSLDEYFVKNMYEYDTFSIGGSIEDYDLWVITAIFNKSEIDYEGTIHKRLIKDNGFFWDELTGEMIFNDGEDVKLHPYSHENEILVKKNSKPRILNIEKINMERRY